MEEALRIEENQNQLGQKLAFHIANARNEAKLLERKKEEELAENLELEREEQVTHNLVAKMVIDSDDSLSPITKLLGNFEGTLFIFIVLFLIS